MIKGVLFERLASPSYLCLLIYRLHLTGCVASPISKTVLHKAHLYPLFVLPLTNGRLIYLVDNGPTLRWPSLNTYAAESSPA